MSSREEFFQELSDSLGPLLDNVIENERFSSSVEIAYEANTLIAAVNTRRKEFSASIALLLNDAELGYLGYTGNGTADQERARLAVAAKLSSVASVLNIWSKRIRERVVAQRDADDS